jgi:hypothetical protein
MEPYQQPSVFGFFLPEFVPDGPMAEAGLVAPEFEILDAPKLLGTLNGLVELVTSGLTACDLGFGDERQTSGSTSDCKDAAIRPSLVQGELKYVPASGATAAEAVAAVDLLLTAGRTNAHSRALLEGKYADNYLRGSQGAVLDDRLDGAVLEVREGATWKCLWQSACRGPEYDRTAEYRVDIVSDLVTDLRFGLSSDTSGMRIRGDNGNTLRFHNVQYVALNGDALAIFPLPPGHPNMTTTDWTAYGNTPLVPGRMKKRQPGAVSGQIHHVSAVVCWFLTLGQGHHYVRRRRRCWLLRQHAVAGGSILDAGTLVVFSLSLASLCLTPDYSPRLPWRFWFQLCLLRCASAKLLT